MHATQLKATTTHAFYKKRPFLEYWHSRQSLEQLEISYPIYNKYFLRQYTEMPLTNMPEIWRRLNCTPVIYLGILIGDSAYSHASQLWRTFGLKITRQLDKIEEGVVQWLGSRFSCTCPQQSRKFIWEQPRVSKELASRNFLGLTPTIADQLTIFNSGESLGNDVAGFICKHFKMLRKLTFSDTKTDDTGFSSISGLKSECIMFC